MISAEAMLAVRLGRLVHEATEVSRLFEVGFEKALTVGYPQSLPCFDEVVAALIKWRDAVAQGQGTKGAVGEAR